MQSRFLYCVLPLLVVACSGGSATPGAVDGSTSEPDGGAQQELPDSTVFLTRGDDGVLGGMAVASAGEVHFYSEELEAYWNLTLSGEEEEMPTDAPLEVRVSVSDDREVGYSVIDPTGRFAPIFFASALPDSGMHDLVVDSRAVADMDDPFFTADLMGASPFDELFSVTAGMFVRMTLMSIQTAAALSVIKTFVEGVCQTLMPLHRDTCARIGFALEVGSIAIAPGNSWTKIASWASRRGLVTFGLDVLGFAAGKGCDALGVALESAMNPENPRIAATRAQFRTALTYYNYLLWRLGEDPPADEAKRRELQETLDEMLDVLLVVGPAYRDSYVYFHHPELVPSYNQFATIALGKSIGEYLSRSASVIRGPNLEVLARGLDTLNLDLADHDITVRSEVGGWLAATVAECVIGVVDKVYFSNPEPGPGEGDVLEIDPTESLVEFAEQLTMDLEQLHRDSYGGPPPALTCLADMLEPNGSWRRAHETPLPGVVLGLGEAVMVDGLTLCGIGGMPADEDWYAFPVAPINWRAEARITDGGDDPDCVGCEYEPSTPICMDMYWYSQTNELAGTPPTMLRSQCGDAGSSFSVGPVGVRGTAGETFRQILLHVRPQDPTSTAPVRYNLGFTR